MKDRKKALSDVLGLKVGNAVAKKYFFNVYEYMLYNDTNSFLEILNFRIDLPEQSKADEEYHVFKFMLKLMQSKNMKKLLSLCPVAQEKRNLATPRQANLQNT